MVRLIPHAKEQSTYVVTASFTDENGDAVTPNSGLTWSLTDESGDVVHGRENVAIGSAASVNIVLTGDDLTLASTFVGTRRFLCIEGTYDSTNGTDLNIKQEFVFEIDNIVKLT